MIFNYVELKNFKSYGDELVHLDLNFNGIKLLLGDNGSGKTSFLQAILWCLYGVSSGKVDDIINRQTKKNCKVEVNFTKNNNNYSVIRFRNDDEFGNKLLLFKNNEDISGRTNDITQSILNDILEINYIAMISGMIYSSELYSNFLRARLSDRLKIYEQVLGVDKLKKYYDVIRKMRSDVLAKLNEQKQKIEIINNSKQTIVQNIDDYKEKVKNQLLELKKEQEKLTKQKQQLEESLNKYKDIDVDKELKKIEEYKKLKENAEEIKNKIELEKQKLIDTTQLLSEIKSIEDEINELEKIDISKELEKIDIFEKSEKKIKERNEKINKIESDLKTKKKELKLLEEQIETNKSKINEYEEKIVFLKENTEKCPTCGQQIDKDLNEKLLKEYTQKLNEVDNSQLENESKKLKEKIKALSKELNDLTGICFQYVERPEYSREYLSSLNEKIKGLKNTLSAKKEQFIKFDEQNKKVNKEIENLKSLLKEPNFTPEFNEYFLNNLKNEIENINNEINEVDSKLNEISIKAKTLYDKSYINGLKNKIKVLDKNLEKEKKELVSLEDDDKHYELMVDLFSNKSFGIKKHIFDKTIPYFNEQIATYLPLFFNDNIELSFDLNLEEKIKFNGNEIPFSSFSSGEKSRLELAVSFSLFMLVKSFFSSPVNLLLFDELLDVMNLDKQGITAVINIINDLSKDNSIIVITHRDEYKEFFQNHIYITKENGFSRLLES